MLTLQPQQHGTWPINVPRLPLGRCYRPYRNPALLPLRKGQYNADFYVGGAMANTFPMSENSRLSAPSRGG